MLFKSSMDVKGLFPHNAVVRTMKTLEKKSEEANLESC